MTWIMDYVILTRATAVVLICGLELWNCATAIDRPAGVDLRGISLRIFSKL